MASSPSAAVERATLLIVLSAICFSALGIFTVVATSSGAPLPTVLAGRYAVAAVLLFALARAGARVAGSTLFKLLAAGVAQAAMAYMALSSLRWIPVATMVFLFYTYPAWVALFALLRGSERLDRRHIVSLALALGGVLFMVGSPWSGPLHWTGVSLALGAAVIFAIYIPAIQKLQAEATPVATSAYVAASAAIVFLAGGAGAGAITLDLAPKAVLSIVGLAVVTTTVGFLLFLHGLAVLGPVRTAIVSTIEPFSAAVLGWAILGQPFRGPTLAGGGMIAGAVVLLLAGSRGAEARRDSAFAAARIFQRKAEGSAGTDGGTS